MNERLDFLRAVADGKDVYPLVQKIGYGWAVQEGFVRHFGGADDRYLDFEITAKGLALLTLPHTEGE